MILQRTDLDLLGWLRRRWDVGLMTVPRLVRTRLAHIVRLVAWTPAANEVGVELSGGIAVEAVFLEAVADVDITKTELAMYFLIFKVGTPDDVTVQR